MINYIQHNNLKEDHMIEAFQTLIKYGAKFDGIDSDGLNVLDHAIMKNNESLVNWLLNNQRGLVIDHRQPNGRTAVHMCVNPLGFGSYENVNILRKLHNSGFNLNARDSQGKTPLDYAMEQDSKVMAKEICKLLNTRVDFSVRLRRNSVTPAIDWPDFVHDFTEDAHAFLEDAEKKRAKEVFEKENELDYVPVDKDFHGEK
jgi:ankyrin repeat protein